MVEIRASRQEEVPAQKQLWKLAFGDEDSYIDYFYQNYYSPENMMVLVEDGKLSTMLALFPMTLRAPEGVSARAAYVYALATDPAARKKGYGRQILHYLDFYLRQREVDCVTVVPAEPSLHKFFSSVDFDECFVTREVELLRELVEPVRAGDAIAPVEAGAYNRIRDGLLAGERYVAYSDALVDYQRGLSAMTGTDLFRLTVDGVEGCCAAEYLDDETVVLKELLIPERQMAGAAALVAGHLPALRYHIRTPAFWGGLPGSYTQPFGMVKWYSREKERLWGYATGAYMGFGFD